VDENDNPSELAFHWKGAAHDDVKSLIDRLQKLYKNGMKKFLNEEVTYIEKKQIDRAFRLFGDDPDATKATILDYFDQLKYYTNNDFAFIDVHNEKLFYQNAEVLLKIVRMLQDIKIQTDQQHQFLGDLFEGFLDKGIKQSEGQFFTPTPIVKFLVSSLPLEEVVNAAPEPPRVMDYACGAGHFLNEYCHQIFPFVKKKHGKKKDGIEGAPNGVECVPDLGFFQQYYAAVTGIEKEYRLSKVAKVSAFMYGQDGINIVYADALAHNPGIKDGAYSLLITNPPYSVKGFLETLSDEDRNRFELMRAIEARQIQSNNSIECFFVERAKQLLAPGGVAAIILPSSILNNGNIYTRMREILLKYFDIIAIAEFGSGTFGKTGTNTATLFLRRKQGSPDFAEHVANRVAAWFKGDFAKDKVFKDTHLLHAYCEKIGVPVEDYRTMIKGAQTFPPVDKNDNPQAGMPALLSEHFQDYRKNFENSAECKNIRKKRITEKYTEADRAIEMERAWTTWWKDVESDKLTYFWLAASNPQPVVLVKSPADDKAKKIFLGYEWSSRKGDEGIKYLGTAVAGEDDAFSKNKGIETIKTPLFNPGNLQDSEKINALIRAAFKGETPPISESLTPFVTRAALVDMLDFSRASFDKAFKTTAETKFEIKSKWPLIKLGDVADYSPDSIAAATLTPQTYIGVDNMVQNLGGKVDSSFVPKTGNFTRYDAGDILLSNIRPYLKKIWFADKTGGASNDVLVLRVTDEETDKRFIYYYLAQDAFFDYVMSNKKGMKMPRGDKSHIRKFPIPKLPISIQQKIVAECEKVDAEYNSSRMSIELYKEKIVKIFHDIEYTIRGGATLRSNKNQ